MKPVSLALIASLAFAAATAAAATDPKSPRDSGLPTVNERVKAALAQRQLLGSKRLRLLTYPHGAQPTNSDARRLRFEAQVDVWGKAPRDPNEAISAFLKESDRAIYQGAPPVADFVPLIKWVAKKIKNKTEEKPAQQPQ
jgi:hypothetical protein